MNHSEDVILSNLSDTEELEALVKEGLPLFVVPTEDLRKPIQWAIDYYFQSGQTRAPSNEMLWDNWGELLTRNGVTLSEYETDTMVSAIQTLKHNYAHFRSQRFLREMGTRLATADPVDRLMALRTELAGFFREVDSLSPKYLQTEAQEAIPSRIDAFLRRTQEEPTPQGMLLGLDMIDAHTFGVHDGELLVLAAGPKVGKSWFCARTAYINWKLGKAVAFFTLENSIEMTWDRIVCMLAGVPYRTFQRGRCSEHSKCECVAGMVARMELLRPQVEAMRESGTFHVISPGIGERTPQAIVEKSRALDVDVLVVDQLTFMEHPLPGRKSGWEIVKDLMHDLKSLISAGNKKIPCLLAHQISREGVKAAQREGKLEMYHLAEGSEVERTADWVFGLYQTDASRADQSAILSMLAARREALKAWMLDWTPELGFIDVQGEYVEKKEDIEDDD